MVGDPPDGAIPISSSKPYIEHNHKTQIFVSNIHTLVFLFLSSTILYLLGFGLASFELLLGGKFLLVEHFLFDFS